LPQRAQRPQRLKRKKGMEQWNNGMVGKEKGFFNIPILMNL
jgi:hypothetical protein